MRNVHELQQKEYPLTNASVMVPVTTQSTAATDNLAAVMKNAVVFLEPSFWVIGPPTPRKAGEPGSDDRPTATY